MMQALSGQSEIDEDTWDEIEAMFLQADMGVPTTMKVMDNLQSRNIKRFDQLNEAIKEELRALLMPPTPMNISGRPLSVVMIVGVNGSGKTTTIGKLARRMQLNNRKTLIAAGDTFRAAAIEQVQIWGERAGVPVIAGKPGMDPGAIVYDAVEASDARGAEILVVDTAGRLHSNFNLMQELKKIRKVMSKVVPDAPHETLLVLDGTTGQNALNQAKKFQEEVEITGIIVTKLGVGESIYDLIIFDPDRFVESLFEELQEDQQEN
jgi:fused signal recognition particle receptor